MCCPFSLLRRLARSENAGTQLSRRSALPALPGWTRHCNADRLRRTRCCECGRLARATASPHWAVLYPAEEVFRVDALGRARRTLHSEVVVALLTTVSHLPRHRGECLPFPATLRAVSGQGLRSR